VGITSAGENNGNGHVVVTETASRDMSRLLIWGGEDKGRR
jgi:hypothetical protein